MKKLNGYPDWFFYLLLGAMLMSALTGLALLPWVMEFKLEWELGSTLPGSMRLPIVSSHALASFILLMLLGALWQVHIRAGWRRQENHKSGLMLALSLLLLMLTGSGLYYLSSSEWQLSASLIHSAAGLMLSLGFIWHWIAGRRIRHGHIARAKHR